MDAPTAHAPMAHVAAPRGDSEMPATKTLTRTRPRKPADQKPAVWNLRLYVADSTPKSVRAFSNLKAMCEEHLKGRYRIEVIDLRKHPQLARGDQIVAIPT